MNTNLRMLFLGTMTSALVCGSFVATGFSQGLVQQPIGKPVSKELLIQLVHDREIRGDPNWEQFIRKEWIEKKKIGFLPTAAARRDLKDAGVPDTLLDVLRFNVSARIRWQVFRFLCLIPEPRECARFNDKVRAELKQRLGEINLGITEEPMLVQRGIRDELADLDNWKPPKDIDEIILLAISGVLKSEGGQYQAEISVSQKTRSRSDLIEPAGFKRSVPRNGAELDKLATDVSSWVLTTLKSVFQ